jgi:hypothetical protein
MRRSAHDAKERAVAMCLPSMLEEHFGILFMRWTTDDGWTVFEPVVRKMLDAMSVPAMHTLHFAPRPRASPPALPPRDGTTEHSRQ